MISDKKNTVITVVKRSLDLLVRQAQTKIPFFTVACSMQGIITPSHAVFFYGRESGARFDGSAFYSYCVHAGGRISFLQLLCARRQEAGIAGERQNVVQDFLSHAHQRFFYRFFSCREVATTERLIAKGSWPTCHIRQVLTLPSLAVWLRSFVAQQRSPPCGNQWTPRLTVTAMILIGRTLAS